MAKRRDVEISIAPDGTISVHVKGLPGKQCLKIKEILEQSVGALQSQRFTAEYYEPEEPGRVRLDLH